MKYLWWDPRGIIPFHFLNRSQIPNADLYLQQLQRVHENLLRKRSILVNWRNIVLLTENTRRYSTRITLEKTLDLSWFVLPYPPYSSPSSLTKDVLKKIK